LVTESHAANLRPDPPAEPLAAAVLVEYAVALQADHFEKQNQFHQYINELKQ
jgi:hypothetical protein